jgi:transposase
VTAPGPDHKEENKMMVSQTVAFVGIDVGKFECVAAVHGRVGRLVFAPTAVGIAGFLGQLRDLGCPVRIGLEATGGYEAPLWEALAEAGCAVRQLPPARVHAFARSRGRLAKTDGCDAATIAPFLADQPEAGRGLPEANIRQIKALTTKRRQLTEMRAALLCQMQQARDPGIQALDTAHLAFLDGQIADLLDRIETLITRDSDLSEKRSLLRSIPGIGPVVCSTLLADMPELGTLPPKAAAALAGLAPYNRDSGTKSGKRFIRGGRTDTRTALYMAALAARRFNPDLKAFADRLKAKGKPAKQVIIAVARKLIELANAILARKTKWLPR